MTVQIWAVLDLRPFSRALQASIHDGQPQTRAINHVHLLHSGCALVSHSPFRPPRSHNGLQASGVEDIQTVSLPMCCI